MKRETMMQVTLLQLLKSLVLSQHNNMPLELDEIVGKYKHWIWTEQNILALALDFHIEQNRELKWSGQALSLSLSSVFYCTQEISS